MHSIPSEVTPYGVIVTSSANFSGEILSKSFGLKVIDSPENFEYPTTRDASGVDPVFVGRIRKNLAFDNGISLWCVADNLRIGAALNTVRICKKVIEMGLY